MLLYSKVIHVKKKRKIKTKNFLIFIICILLIIISITYGIKKLETTNKKNDKNSTEEKNTKTNNNKDNSKEEKELTELEKAKKDLDYYIDENTEKYQEYRNKNKDLSIEKVITNVNIGLNDAYYTNTKESKYQNTLYNNYAKRDGYEAADTYSARPGYSEHQTGLAVDIDNGKEYFTNFEKTKEFTWMQENAYKFGFILRFPENKVTETGYQYESWHYRYVGKEIAKYIHDNDLCFEEYYARFLIK